MTNETPNSAAEGKMVLLAEALRRNEKRLKLVFYSFRLRHEDAEDVFQEVALLAAAKLGEIENLDAWLPAVALNLCIVRSRRLKRRRHLLRLDDLPEDLEPVRPPDQQRLEIQMDLQKGLSRLSRSLKSVVSLWAQGFNNREIAARTGYSGESIRKLIWRAARQIRAIEVREINPRSIQPNPADPIDPESVGEMPKDEPNRKRNRKLRPGLQALMGNSCSGEPSATRFRRLILQEMIKRGISEADLAEACDCSGANIRQIFEGGGRLRFDTADKLCRAMGLRLIMILDEEKMA
jgi:RNA polymerase sigma factor (sigma-70 family)